MILKNLIICYRIYLSPIINCKQIMNISDFKVVLRKGFYNDIKDTENVSKKSKKGK